MKYLLLLLILFLISACASVERPYLNSNRLSLTHNQNMRW